MATIEELLRQYRTNRADSLKQEIVIACLPLVKYLAGRLMVKMSSVIEQEDLESYGMFGLLESIEKYNPDMGTNFKTYAYSRIRGSMIDEFRKISWVPRTIYQKIQKLNNTKEQLQIIHGKDVTDEMLAQAMGVSLQEVNKLNGQSSQSYFASLDEPTLTNDGESVCLVEMISDPGSPDPAEILEEKESKYLLAKYVSELPEKDQLILSLYYQEKFTLKEISKVLEVSESRVCQLHTRAIKRLRKSIEAENGPGQRLRKISKKDVV